MIKNYIGQDFVLVTAGGVEVLRLRPDGLARAVPPSAYEGGPALAPWPSQDFCGLIPVALYAPPAAIEGLPDPGDDPQAIIVPLAVAAAMRELGIRWGAAVYTPKPLVFRDGAPLGSPGLLFHRDLSSSEQGAAEGCEAERPHKSAVASERRCGADLLAEVAQIIRLHARGGILGDRGEPERVAKIILRIVAESLAAGERELPCGHRIADLASVPDPDTGRRTTLCGACLAEERAPDPPTRRVVVELTEAEGQAFGALRFALGNESTALGEVAAAPSEVTAVRAALREAAARRGVQWPSSRGDGPTLCGEERALAAEREDSALAAEREDPSARFY